MNIDTDLRQKPTSGPAAETGAGVAIVIPCLDEAANIAGVIEGFRRHLPDAEIYVYDNASTDGTAGAAQEAGAIVRHEARRGKGHVVRRIFRDVEADIYLMVDGDLTYDPAAAPEMIATLRRDQLDIVIGARVGDSDTVHRLGHRLGNRMLTGIIARLFKAELRDMLSGYRAMSRRFVKSFPVGASGFDIETELTVHMLQIDVAYREIDTDYSNRGTGTESKLRTVPDGLRVLRTIIKLVILERPVAVFGGFGLVALIVALAMFLPVLQEFQRTGVVPRIPTLIVSVSLGMTGLVSVFSGLILAGIARTRRDMKRLAHMALPAVSRR